MEFLLVDIFFCKIFATYYFFLKHWPTVRQRKLVDQPRAFFHYTFHDTELPNNVVPLLRLPSMSISTCDLHLRNLTILIDTIQTIIGCVATQLRLVHRFKTALRWNPMATNVSKYILVTNKITVIKQTKEFSVLNTRAIKLSDNALVKIRILRQRAK